MGPSFVVQFLLHTCVCLQRIMQLIPVVLTDFTIWPSLPPSLPASRLGRLGRGSAWKQAAARVTAGRIDALPLRGVALLAVSLHGRSLSESHFPLLSLSSWIKHLPSCSRMDHSRLPPKTRGARVRRNRMWDTYKNKRIQLQTLQESHS